ncbi:type IV secretory system conjugative DNA transfer family protein [Francisella sp. TX07-6608]|uniref:type IV secretory system conjugative DNA transfer family protein n=2 Tax=Francisella sp. TX07-6608 TaxID=573568 RepID=UPI0008F9C67E|nr:type IV secretory system conjugative DNA transfer family protein [Francisella sp. TX07-6608]OIN85125.1 type IV secretory system Conjugative DNA transfer family protein [Francisella sp. TX07-6608]
MYLGICIRSKFFNFFKRSKPALQNNNGKYGAAKFTDSHDLKAMNFIHSPRKTLTNKYPVYVVGSDGKNYIGSTQLENTITIGRRGTGKATTGSILTLLEADVNCLVNDVKGELFMTTFAQRINMGKRPIAVDIVKTLDRFHDFSEYMCIRFNPLWNSFLINASLIQKTLYLDALVSAFIMDTTDRHEKHWVDKSRSVLRGFLSIAIEDNIKQHQQIKQAKKQLNAVDFKSSTNALHKLEDLDEGEIVKDLNGKYKIVKNQALQDFDEHKSKQNLIDVKRAFAKASKEELQQILEKANSQYNSSFIDEAIGTLIQAGKDNELGGILTTLNKATAMLANPAIADFFKSPQQTDIILDIKDYLVGNTDIYIICPEDQLSEYPGILALFINMIRVGVKLIDRRDKHDEYLFILDEIGQLGYLPSIETIDSIGRDAGFIQHLYFQSMDQINKYQNKNMLKNFEIIRFFRTSEPETIRHLNYIGGKQTIQEDHQSISKNNSSLLYKQVTSSDREVAIDLIPVDMIRTLPDDEQIIVFNGQIIRCKKVYYYQDKKYKNKYGINYSYRGSKHLCQPYNRIDNYINEIPQESSSLEDIQKSLANMIITGNDMIVAISGLFYINLANLKHIILKYYADNQVDEIIKQLDDLGIISIKSDHDNLYKINY